MTRIIKSAVYFPFVNYKRAFVLEIFDCADNSFYTQTRHVSNLLTRKLYAIAILANVFFGFFEVGKQISNPVFRITAGKFFQQQEFEPHALRH